MTDISSSDYHPYKEAVRTLRHDARNLLNGISIMADHFEGSDDPKAARFIAYLNEKVETMVRVGERAETFASLQADDTETVKITTLLADLLSGLSEDARPKLDLAARELRCDRKLTSLALQELLDNAVRTESQVAISSFEEGGDVVIEIRDHGPGIAGPAEATLLTPFKGAKRAGGTSLGLPIANRAMELQGGTLTVRAAEGGGTEVACRWPQS
jgi:signal transduction histidine kinase